MYDGDQFKNSSKIPTFLLRPFLTMLNLEVDSVSLQKIENEMDRTEYPVGYIFSEI